MLYLTNSFRESNCCSHPQAHLTPMMKRGKGGVECDSLFPFVEPVHVTEQPCFLSIPPLILLPLLFNQLRLLRVELTKQLLRVDDNTPTIDDLSGAKNNLFDLDGKLYLGGVEKTMYPSLPKEISSRHGFVGCLASLDLNGYLPNVLREAKPITESVGDGCRGEHGVGGGGVGQNALIESLLSKKVSV